MLLATVPQGSLERRFFLLGRARAGSDSAANGDDRACRAPGRVHGPGQRQRCHTRGWEPSAAGRPGNEGPAGPGAVALSAGLLLLGLAAAGRWGRNAAGQGLRSLGGASSSSRASTRPASVCDCRLGGILRDGACASVSDVAHYPLAAAGWDAACPGWVERAERLRLAVKEVQWDGCRLKTFAPSVLPRFGFGAHFHRKVALSVCGVRPGAGPGPGVRRGAGLPPAVCGRGLRGDLLPGALEQVRRGSFRAVETEGAPP